MIKPIQYLRAVAALMVVWHHAFGQVPGNLNFIHPPEFGLSGVDLFFVISGFIMFVTTIEKPLTPRNFFELRIVRVVPLYWLMTLLAVGWGGIAPSAFKTLRFSPAAVAKSLLFIPYDSLSFPGNAWPVLVPGWTLNYEMFFYAVFALTLIIPMRWRPTSLVVTLIFLVLTGKILGPSQIPFVWVYTSPLLLEFGAGAVIGCLWVRRTLHIPLAVSVVSIVTGAYLLVMRDKPPFMNYSQMIGAPLVVAGCLHPAICVLRSRMLLALGDASYSIYLTHMFTLGALREVWLRLVPQVSLMSVITNMVVALIVCAVSGFMVYRCVEKPLTTRLRLVIGPPTFKARSARAGEFATEDRSSLLP
jgi:exopolysaccharide production protein ExoZ